MRRRTLLAGGTALAMCSATARLARASVPDEPAVPAWTLRHGAARYVIAAQGPAVTADCFPPGGAATAPRTEPAATQPVPVMIAVGPSADPVSWRVATSYQPDQRTVRLALTATTHPLDAELVFAIDPSTGVLNRRTVIRHRGIGPDVEIVATLAFWFRLHEAIDGMRHLEGVWGHEAQVQRLSGAQPFLLASRAGKTGFDFQPYLALRAGGATYLCEICWSGNWQLEYAPGDAGAVLSGGLNNWRFRHRLHPTGHLRLPDTLFGRFAGDVNEATQRLHDYRRARRPDPERPIPVQFNSWYPYFGEPSTESMLPMVPLAARLGCEAFVVDAGWHSGEIDDPVADWTERTGDWHTSRRRFPGGLREVGERCREHGLRFGLWFEPEAVGRLSAVRREHPEWLHHIDGNPPASDERAVLNLGVPAARRYIFERITRILSGVGVGWMKWDFNADLGAGGWAPGLPAELTDQDPLVAHYEGLYRLQDAVRRWFPELVLEMCAGGGGRMDCALLSRAHVNWLSDWPGAVRKLAIHMGAQLAHPAVVCNDWLVEWPPHSVAGFSADETEGIDERGDLPFRLRVAMLGSLGISARIDRWPEADFATVARHIALYREKLRAIIHHGDQYLLTRVPPGDGDGDWAAIWYVAKDGSRGVLFVFRLAGDAPSRSFPLAGLTARRAYRVTTGASEIVRASGDTLAAGLDVAIPARFQSELCLVEAGEPVARSVEAE